VCHKTALHGRHDPPCESCVSAFRHRSNLVQVCRLCKIKGGSVDSTGRSADHDRCLKAESSVTYIDKSAAEHATLAWLDHQVYDSVIARLYCFSTTRPFTNPEQFDDKAWYEEDNVAADPREVGSWSSQVSDKDLDHVSQGDILCEHWRSETKVSLSKRPYL
jgi:hypothetical protein